jgi:hypothetical protein
VGEFRACGARRTLGTCPVFAKPVGTNFARSRRFREVPSTEMLQTWVAAPALGIPGQAFRHAYPGRQF